MAKESKVVDKDLPICPLWYGGHCPYCDSDYELYGFSSHREGREANRLCCRTHRDPTDEELHGKL